MIVRNFLFLKTSETLIFKYYLTKFSIRLKGGQCHTNLSTTELLAAHLIHRSSQMGRMSAYKPNVIDGRYQRSVDECPKN